MRVLLPLCLLAAVAAGCGAAASTRQHAQRDAAPVDAAPVVHPAAPPKGFRTHAVTGAGISIALPIGWQTLGQRDAVFPGARENLTRLDASFGPSLNELGSPDSPLKLFAFDRRFRRGHPTTVMVMQATYTRPGRYSRWAPRMVAALRHAPGRRGRIAAAPIALQSGTALRATYRTAGRDTVVVYLVPGATGLWALMLRTPTVRATRDGATFTQAARSFVLRAPTGGAQ